MTQPHASHPTANPILLERFLEAQENVFDQALHELRAGHKRSQWMWITFPQIHGLGSSGTAIRYAIKSIEEARAYLAHPVLGPRLLACCQALIEVNGKSPTDKLTRDAGEKTPASVGRATAIVVCLCGSSRWPELHHRVMMEETLAGNIVIPLGLYGHADYPPGAKAATNDGDEATAVKQMLDRLHYQKIDLSDEIIVVSDDGYFGSSTRREIAYAQAQGKRVRYRQNDIMGCPDDMKLRSSMTLFALAAGNPDPFLQVLSKYFGGHPDPATCDILGPDGKWPVAGDPDPRKPNISDNL